MLRSCAILTSLLLGACSTGPSGFIRAADEAAANARCSSAAEADGGMTTRCVLSERTTTTTSTLPDGTTVSTTTTTLPNGDVITTTTPPKKVGDQA